MPKNKEELCKCGHQEYNHKPLSANLSRCIGIKSCPCKQFQPPTTDIEHVSVPKEQIDRLVEDNKPVLEALAAANTQASELDEILSVFDTGTATFVSDCHNVPIELKNNGWLCPVCLASCGGSVNNHRVGFSPEVIKARAAVERLLTEAENYGRIAVLRDLTTWLKLHDIEDVTMVQDFAEHVETSIKQFPDQRHVEYPEIRTQLRKQNQGSKV